MSTTAAPPPVEQQQTRPSATSGSASTPGWRPSCAGPRSAPLVAAAARSSCYFSFTTDGVRTAGRREHLDLHLVVVRDHGRGRGAADDRRRVRPVGRRDDRHDRPDHRHHDVPLAHQRVGRGRSPRWWWRSRIGFLNGFLVMKTGLPSFIVTLGTFFVLRGVNLAVVKQIIHQVSVVDFQSAPGYAAGQQAVRLLHQDRPRLAALGGRPGHRLPDGSTPPPGGRSRVDHRGHLGPAAHPRRQLDLRRRRRADQRPAGRRPGVPDQGRAVHDHRVRRLDRRHAHPLQDHHGPVDHRRRARSSSTSSAPSSAAAC